MKRRIVAVIKRAIGAFIAHDVLTLAAALAFYTLLSFAPLMVILLWTTGAFEWATRDALLGEIAQLAGNDARIAAQAVIDSVRHHSQLGAFESALGVGVVLFGATSVFAQLQSTLNVIWDIPSHSSSAVWSWLRRRIISAGLLLAIGFVLIVSTVISSGLAMVLMRNGISWDIVNELASAAIFSGLFTVLFRYLPDERLHWRHAWGGGIATAILFVIGKWVIGAYLTRGNIGGAYGAAGSMVVLLVWTYYSATVFFFAAELLQAWVVEGGGAVSAGSRHQSSMSLSSDKSDLGSTSPRS